MPLLELRLTRVDHNLCTLAVMLKGRRVIRVRYTRLHMIALYQ